MSGSKRWMIVAAFWIFVAVLYDGQLLWLSRMPGERIDLRAAFAWQTTYYLLWIPFTLIVWRVSAGWIPESSRRWPRILARHVPVFAAVALAHFVTVTALSLLLGVGPQPGFWAAVVMQMLGR